MMSTLVSCAERVTWSRVTAAKLDMSLLSTPHSWWQSPGWHPTDIHPFHHAAGGSVHPDRGVRVSPQTHGPCPGSQGREPGQEEHALLCESLWHDQMIHVSVTVRINEPHCRSHVPSWPRTHKHTLEFILTGAYIHHPAAPDTQWSTKCGLVWK